MTYLWSNVFQCHVSHSISRIQFNILLLKTGFLKVSKRVHILIELEIIYRFLIDYVMLHEMKMRWKVGLKYVRVFHENSSQFVWMTGIIMFRFIWRLITVIDKFCGLLLQKWLYINYLSTFFNFFNRPVPTARVVSVNSLGRSDASFWVEKRKAGRRRGKGRGRSSN